MPLSYPFMQRALIVSVLVGAVCAVLSCYLVLKGWSLMGDAISHAVLPGIVIAYVVGLPLAVGAFAAGLSCALFTGYLKENSRVKEDTVMGVVFTGMFGFGLVIFTKVETDQHLDHILFGNMLGVTARPDRDRDRRRRDARDRSAEAPRSAALLLRSQPRAHHRPAGARAALRAAVLLALTIVASLKAVGIILVIAMLIAPGCHRVSCSPSFERMLVIATAVATVSAAIGTIVSFHIPGHRAERRRRPRHRRLRSPGPGAEIHDYQPTPLDIVKAQAADLVLWNGFNLERWFERFFQNVKDVPSVVVTEGVEPLGITEGPYNGKPNPHAWMSPNNALIYVENIRKAFAKHDPANAEDLCQERGGLFGADQGARRAAAQAVRGDSEEPALARDQRRRLQLPDARL